MAVNGCNYVVFWADHKGPAEYCTEDAEPGSDFCREHDPELGEPDWDDRRKDELVGAYDCWD